MKKKPKNIPSPYKFAGTPIFRDTTALPFAVGGPLNDRDINGNLLNSTYASPLGNMFKYGGFGEDQGTFDYARSNYASSPGNSYKDGGQFQGNYSLPEDSYRQGGNNLHDSIYASSPQQYPAVYKQGGSLLSMSNTPQMEGEGKDLVYQNGGSLYNKTFTERYNPSPMNYKQGGGIHIKPSHEGDFTAKANAADMSVQAFASKVLSAPEGQYDPITRQQANFARNSVGWNHAMGGNMYANGGSFNNPGFRALPQEVQNKIRTNINNKRFEMGGPTEGFQGPSKPSAAFPSMYIGATPLAPIDLKNEAKHHGLELRNPNAEPFMDNLRETRGFESPEYQEYRNAYYADKMNPRNKAFRLGEEDRLNNYEYGTTFENGGEMAQLTEFNAGGKHSENPIGGIPQGVAPDGNVNLVEQGETKLNSANYIFSDTIKLDKETAGKFGLPKTEVNKTFADISKKLNRPNSRRENDSIEEAATKRNLDELMSAQEEQKRALVEQKMQEIQALDPNAFAQMQGQGQPQQQGMPEQGQMVEQGAPEMMQQSVQPMGMPEGQPVDPSQMSPEMLAQMPEAQQGAPVMALGGGMYKCGGKMYNFGGNMYANGGHLMWAGGSAGFSEQQGNRTDDSDFRDLSAGTGATEGPSAASQAAGAAKWAGVATQAADAVTTWADEDATDQQKGRAAYNTGVAAAGTIVPPVGAAIALGNAIGQPIKKELEQYNEKGELINEGGAKAGYIANAVMDPFSNVTNLMANSEASGGRKVLGALTGGYSEMFNAGKYTEQLEKDEKARLGIEDARPTSSGGTGAVMAKNGGRLPSYHQFPAIYPTYANNAGPMGQDLGNLYADGGTLGGPGDPPTAAAPKHPLEYTQGSYKTETGKTLPYAQLGYRDRVLVDRAHGHSVVKDEKGNLVYTPNSPQSMGYYADSDQSTLDLNKQNTFFNTAYGDTGTESGVYNAGGDWTTVFDPSLGKVIRTRPTGKGYQTAAVMEGGYNKSLVLNPDYTVNAIGKDYTGDWTKSAKETSKITKKFAEGGMMTPPDNAPAGTTFNLADRNSWMGSYTSIPQGHDLNAPIESLPGFGEQIKANLATARYKNVGEYVTDAEKWEREQKGDSLSPSPININDIPITRQTKVIPSKNIPTKRFIEQPTYFGTTLPNSPEYIAKQNAVNANREANEMRIATEGPKVPETTRQKYIREQAEFQAKNRGYEQGGYIEDVNVNLQPMQLPGANIMSYGQQMYQPLEHITQYGGNLYAPGGPLDEDYDWNADYNTRMSITEPIPSRGLTNRESSLATQNFDPYVKTALQQAEEDLRNAETEAEHEEATNRYLSELERKNTELEANTGDYKIERNLGKDLMIAAPAVTNIATGLFEKAEQLNPAEYMTPADLKAYQMNIDPLRRGIQQNYAQATAAARNAGLPGGTYMANVGALNVGANRALHEAEIAKQNADAQSFAATQAANKGIESQNKQMKMGIKDFNLKSKAAKRQALTTGLTQLAQMGEGAYNLDAQMALAKAVSPEFGDRIGFDSTYWEKIQKFAKDQASKAKTKKDLTNEENNSI